jgi:hypothetical protein
VPVPRSSAVIGAVQLHSGLLVGVGTDRQLYMRATIASPWRLVPRSGRVVSVSQLADGALVAAGADRCLYRADLAVRQMLAERPYDAASN